MESLEEFAELSTLGPSLCQKRSIFLAKTIPEFPIIRCLQFVPTEKRVVEIWTSSVSIPMVVVLRSKTDVGWTKQMVYSVEIASFAFPAASNQRHRLFFW